jgi:hypothetical protein
VEVDARDFLVVRGFNTDEVLLEAARRMDESGAVLPQHGLPEAGGLEPVKGSAEPPPLHGPALRGELTIRLMNAAATVVRRGILLALRGEEAHGVGQFGMAPDRPEQRGKVVVSLRLRSVLSEAAHRKEPMVGPVEPGPGNSVLLAQLGAESPSEALVAPMIVNGSVAMLFYGDNLPERAPIGPIDAIARAILEVSLAMEQEALDERQRDFARRYGP